MDRGNVSGQRRVMRTIRAWQAVFLAAVIGGIAVATQPGGGGFAAVMIVAGALGFFVLVGIVGYNKPRR
jgi:hypothetical protein